MIIAGPDTLTQLGLTAAIKNNDLVISWLFLPKPARLTGLPKALFDTQHFAVDEESISWKDRLSKFDAIGAHKVADLSCVLGLVHHDNARNLRHRFGRNDCGCDGGCGSTTAAPPAKAGEKIDAPKKMPEPPAWLESTCAAEFKADTLLEKGCVLFRQSKETPSQTYLRRHRQAEIDAHEKPTHTSFLEHVHFDGGWVRPQSDARSISHSRASTGRASPW